MILLKIIWLTSFDDHNLGLLMGEKALFAGMMMAHSNYSIKDFASLYLLAIGNSEAMKIKDRIKDNGNWVNGRTPLITIFMLSLIPDGLTGRSFILNAHLCRRPGCRFPIYLQATFLF
jgi:hypothetical protein